MQTPGTAPRGWPALARSACLGCRSRTLGRAVGRQLVQPAASQRSPQELWPACERPALPLPLPPPPWPGQPQPPFSRRYHAVHDQDAAAPRVLRVRLGGVRRRRQGWPEEGCQEGGRQEGAMASSPRVTSPSPYGADEHCPQSGLSSPSAHRRRRRPRRSWRRRLRSRRRLFARWDGQLLRMTPHLFTARA